MSKPDSWWDAAFQRTIAVIYYGSAAYFLVSATYEGHFWGFASGLITAWILPLFIIIPWIAIAVFGSLQIIGSAVFGLDAPFDFLGLWNAIRAVWLLVSAINIWIATIWSEDAQSISQVWSQQTSDWTIFSD